MIRSSDLKHFFVNWINILYSFKRPNLTKQINSYKAIVLHQKKWNRVGMSQYQNSSSRYDTTKSTWYSIPSRYHGGKKYLAFI